jgi:hypothetical protein
LQYYITEDDQDQEDPENPVVVPFDKEAVAQEVVDLAEASDLG